MTPKKPRYRCKRCGAVRVGRCSGPEWKFFRNYSVPGWHKCYEEGIAPSWADAEKVPVDPPIIGMNPVRKIRKRKIVINRVGDHCFATLSGTGREIAEQIMAIGNAIRTKKTKTKGRTKWTSRRPQ